MMTPLKETLKFPFPFAYRIRRILASCFSILNFAAACSFRRRRGQARIAPYKEPYPL